MKNKQKYNSVRTIPKSDIEIVVLVVETMMIIVYVAS
jgi:hypothetical protein